MQHAISSKEEIRKKGVKTTWTTTTTTLGSTQLEIVPNNVNNSAEHKHRYMIKQKK